MFLDVLGIGIIIPILPALVTEFSGGDPAVGALYYGPIVSIFALMQFIFSPILGGLSDQYGRRPVLLIALFGYGINYIILGLAPTLMWLIVGRMFAGITGASITTANAYLADLSTPETRAKNFGLVGAAFGLGFIFGPALGGILGEINPRMPFFASAILAFLNFTYGAFVLPESLPLSSRRPFSWRDANPFHSLSRLRRYPMVSGLAIAFVFMGMARRGMESVWVLYTELRFGWQELENGLSLALIGLLAALVQGVLIRWIVPKLGEHRAIFIGLTLSGVGYVLFGLAPNGWMALLIFPITSLGAIAGPTIQGLLTAAVPPDEQGAIQGSLTSLLSLVAIFAPLISTQLLSHFSSDSAPIYLPGMPFFLGSVLFFCALGIVMRVLSRN